MIYNFKSENLMQDVVNPCLCTIIDDIEDEFYNLHRFDSLSIYAPSCIAREILCRLLKVEDIDKDEIREDFWFHEESDEFLLWSADDTEVIVTIGYDGMIWVEYARLDDGHIKVSEATLSYVYDEFSQRDVLDIIDDENSVLVFGFEDEFEETEYYDDLEECCEESESNCHCDDTCDLPCCHEADYPCHSDEEYFVNGKHVSKEEYDEKRKIFDETMNEFLHVLHNRLGWFWM